MTILSKNDWQILEAYLCSLSLNQKHHDLVSIELKRPVDIGDKHFEAGDYERPECLA